MTDSNQSASGVTELDKTRQPGAQGSVPLPSEEEKALLKEAEALALYLGRHGDAIGDNSDRKTAYETLVEATDKLRVAAAPGNWTALLIAYSGVTAFTYAERGVNGRTILDTDGRARGGTAKNKYNPWAPRRRPLTVGLMLFAGALLLEWMVSQAAYVSDATNGEWVEVNIYKIIAILGPFLIPVAWGGIGACIFLMKRLSDKLFELAYEESRVRGDGTRIFLGAMLGVIVVVVFFPNYGDQLKVGDVTFGPAVAAFLAGLGIKPVYAGFEALSEGLASRIGGKGKEKTA